MKTNGKPPRLRQLRLLREIFLMTQPPLLAVMQGGEFGLTFRFHDLPADEAWSWKHRCYRYWPRVRTGGV